MISLKNVLLTLVLAAAGNVLIAQAGEWVKLGKSGGSAGSATVYCPVRKQVLSWGGFKSGNEVRALDLAGKKWSSDYQSDKWNAHSMGGSFYGGCSHAGWQKNSDRPGPLFLFRQACWDSKRKRMVISALNLTAAYDPATKKWTDLKGSIETIDGKTIPGKPPAGHMRPWFMTVPGQWGSMCFDAVNDQILLFPLWACRGTHQTPKTGKTFRTAVDLPDDAGVSAGHYGTLIFDCKTNVWKRPELGGKEMLALRTELKKLINAQRGAARAGWQALVLKRSEKQDQAAKLIKTAGQAQKQVSIGLAAFRKKLKASELKGYEAGQIKDALANLAAPLKRTEGVAAGLSAGKLAELPALCSQQRAAYRQLRLVRKHDLYVQPIARTSTSVVYDSKNQCIVMAGGNHLDSYLSDTWVYDCASRRWQRKAPAPEAANWPGMCYDSKRGLILYAADKGTYAYDPAADKWSKVGPGKPQNSYCDMAYDAAADLYVLNVSGNKYPADETTYTMKPTGAGSSVATKAASREKVNDLPFPPSADSTAVARLKSLPANSWVAAKPNFQPTHRSWSTMSWDPTMRAVIYQGGGHAGTMDNQISAYFPESNKWVKSFKTQRTPRLFGSWSCAGRMRAMERGMGLSLHCRWYGSRGGRMIFGGQTGFDWATREKHSHGNLPKCPFRYSRGWVVHPRRPEVIMLSRPSYYGPQTGQRVFIYNLETGKSQMHKIGGPTPTINFEWSALAVHPDKDILVLHGSGDHRKKTATATWVLDLKTPSAWKKLELKKTTPSVGMSKLNAIPGTDMLVCAMPNSNDLWVLSLDRQEWQPLGTDEGKKFQRKGRLLDIYGQCVYDPHHKVFVAMSKGYGSRTRTMLLRPDFSKINWGEK
jgi:galactose oxidase-like protein